MNQSEYWSKFARQKLSRRGLLEAGIVTGAGLWAGSALGCGSGNQSPTAASSSGNTSSGSSPTKAAVSASPTAQPKSGGSYVRRDASDPRSLDPDFETTPAASIYPTMAGNGVVRFNQDSTKILLELAESSEQPDESTYIFKLRKGVKFHNVPPVNGREFVSDDVKFSIERQSTDAAAFVHSYYFKGQIAKIETPDKYTVKFTTTRPYAPFMAWLANPFSIIKCREAVEKFGDLKTTAIGTGPFIFKSYQPGVEGIMVKNPDYWKSGKPYLDEVHIRYVLDPQSAAAMFVGKELDACTIDFSVDDQTRKQRPDATYLDMVESMYPFMLRTQPYDDKHPHKAPMDNLKVRQAIQYATDKQEYIDVVSGGKGYQMVGMVAPSRKPWALPDSEQIKQDLTKAKQLMAEAGYPNGFKIELVISNTSTSVDAGQVAKGQMAKIGIDCDLKMYPDAQYRNIVYAFDYMLNVHNMLGNSEPEDYFKPYYGAGATYYRWGNLDLQKKIDEQGTIMDQAKRVEAIHEIQRMVQQDAPQVPLYVGAGTVGFQKRVKDARLPWNQYDFQYLEDVWLSE